MAEDQQSASATQKTSNTSDESNGSCGMQKRKIDDEESIARTRPKRITNNVDRLGATEYEVNDDSFFERTQQKQTHSETDVEKPGGNSSNSALNLQDDGDATATKVVNAEEAAEENSVEKTANKSSTDNVERHVQMMSPGEKAIYGKLLDLVGEFKVLQKAVSELATVNHQTVHEKGNCLQRLKKSQLTELGLPLENVTQMNAFEHKLKDGDFHKKAVCSTYFNLTYNIVFIIYAKFNISMHFSLICSNPLAERMESLVVMLCC